MSLRHGDVVYVWWLGLPVKHYGIVVSEGSALHEPIIRTVFPGCRTPQNQTLTQFTNGSSAEVRRRKISASMSGSQAAIKAMSVVGFEYNLLTNNCEHFIKRCYGLPEFSEQVAILACAIPIVAAFALRGRAKLIS